MNCLKRHCQIITFTIGMLLSTLSSAFAVFPNNNFTYDLGVPSSDPQSDPCRHALQKDLLSIMSTDQQHFSYFSQIDEKTFEQLKVDINTNVAVPIPLPSEMVAIIKASASFSEFQEKRHTYFQQVGYVQDSTREVRILQTTTSPIAYIAWSECIKTLAAEKHILVMYKDFEDESTVHVKIHNGTVIPVKMQSDLLHATVSGQAAGKAFKDNTTITANGTLSILLKRADKHDLKFSITAKPAVDGELFITSIWGKIEKSKLTGTLKVIMSSSRIEDRGAIFGDITTTPELHNKGCDHAPCTGDGKYQLASGAATIDAQPGKKLRSPGMVCHQDSTPGGGCGWANEEGNAHCVVAEGGYHAACSYLTGSRKHWIKMHANQYEIVSTEAPPSDQPIILFEGGEFILRVPTQAKSAIFEYKTPTGRGTLKPGDQSSPDGHIILLGQTSASDATYYTYRVN